MIRMLTLHPKPYSKRGSVLGSPTYGDFHMYPTIKHRLDGRNFDDSWCLSLGFRVQGVLNPKPLGLGLGV